MKLIDIDLAFLPEGIKQSVAANQVRVQQAWEDLTSRRCRGSEFTGWVDFPERRGFQLADTVLAKTSNLKVDYDSVLVIGIGGSYLGTRAITTALGSEYRRESAGKRPVFYAGHHLSSRALNQLLDVISTYKPIVNVISKSGTTTEPAIAFRVIRDALIKRFGAEEANARIIATTDPKSGALRKMAEANGWMSFEVPSDIGGRFSVLTAVGLVPLALAGYDIKAMMDGAATEFKSVFALGADAAGSRYAAARFACLQAGKQIELLAYAEPNANYLAEWWKQLFGESEGKDGKGLFPASLAYTTDLHSLGQIVQEGPRHMFETFLSFAPDAQPIRVPTAEDNVDELQYLEGKSIDEVNDTAFKATKVAHYDGGIPCIALKAGPLKESTLGQLFTFFEVACALTADLMGVNAFDQPGVEAYKKNLFALLGKPGFESLRADLLRRV